MVVGDARQEEGERADFFGKTKAKFPLLLLFVVLVVLLLSNRMAAALVFL